MCMMLNALHALEVLASQIAAAAAVATEAAAELEAQQQHLLGHRQRGRIPVRKFPIDRDDSSGVDDKEEEEGEKETGEKHDGEEEEAGEEHHVDEDREEIMGNLKDVKEELREAKKLVLASEKDVKEFESDYDNILTEEDFIEHAKACGKGAYDKYTQLFSDDQALARARKAFRACQVFDVLYLRSGPSIERLYRLIDELIHFDFSEFDEGFRNNMKKEVPALIKLVDGMKYDFEGDDAKEESQLYIERLKMKASEARKRATLENIDKYLQEQEEGVPGGGYDFVAAFSSIEDLVRTTGEDDSGIGEDLNNDWKQDVGERSRRIYAWWMVVMNEKKDEIPYFQKAVRLVAVVQASSAAVERVFSQLTFIRRAVGDSTLRDTMELRSFIRCNNGLVADFNVIHS